MKLAPALLAALASVAHVAPVAAQAPSDAQPPKQPAAQQGTSLNLKLDHPARFARPLPGSKPAEREATSLPSLGADARPVAREPVSGARTSPYPPDTNPGQ